MMRCTCGCSDAHPVARRQTADGRHVVLWSDGDLTWPFGMRIRGVGRARSDFEARRDLQAGWLLMGDLSAYDAAEIPRLVLAARKAVRQRFDVPLRAMRHYFAGRKLRTVKAGKVFRWVSP